MREQLAQALASQQALIIERDQAKEQCKLAQERASKLQKQLDLLRKVHSKSLTRYVCRGLGHKGMAKAGAAVHPLPHKTVPRVLTEFGQLFTTAYYFALNIDPPSS